MSYVESTHFYRPTAPYFGAGGSSRLVPGWGSSRRAAGPSMIAIGDAAFGPPYEKYSLPLIQSGVPAGIAIPVAKEALVLVNAGAQEAAVLGFLAAVPGWVKGKAATGTSDADTIAWVLSVMHDQIPAAGVTILPPASDQPFWGGGTQAPPPPVATSTKPAFYASPIPKPNIMGGVAKMIGFGPKKTAGNVGISPFTSSSPDTTLTTTAPSSGMPGWVPWVLGAAVVVGGVYFLSPKG